MAIQSLEKREKEVEAERLQFQKETKMVQQIQTSLNVLLNLNHQKSLNF